MTIKLCSNPSRSSYTVGRDGKSITFAPCGVTSWHKGDVEHRYCARCHSFIHTETKVAEHEQAKEDGKVELVKGRTT